MYFPPSMSSLLRGDKEHNPSSQQRWEGRKQVRPEAAVRSCEGSSGWLRNTRPVRGRPPWQAECHRREGERPVTAMAGLREIHPGLPRLRANTTATGPGHDKWAGEEAAKPPPSLSARVWAQGWGSHTDYMQCSAEFVWRKWFWTMSWQPVKKRNLYTTLLYILNKFRKILGSSIFGFNQAVCC